MINPLQQKKINNKDGDSEVNLNTDLIKKTRFPLKDTILLIILGVVALAITIGLILVEFKLKEELENVEVTTTELLDEDDTGQRFWFIDKVEPVGSRYKIDLSSNAGNLRTYENLVSFGLSRDREFIVLNTGNEIKIVKLIDQTSKNIEIPSQKFGGNVGDYISWDSEDQYFTMGVYTDDNQEAGSIWIFDTEGKLVKEIKSKLALDRDNSNKVSPVIFSNTNTYLLARTYKETDYSDRKEDGSKYNILELPIYLSVYNLEGEVIKEIMVRDFDMEKTNLFYTWDTKGIDTVAHYLYPQNGKLDINQDYLFTKIRITNGK